ncbi:hypothetical protein [Flexivirga caeni]|uniref:hypothetical protein n=1 Tax=Flexivirga caeni TaxID=2294115 RepID=UPI001C6568BC|nr:hypothetical protein [Flexivirga caeni]
MDLPDELMRAAKARAATRGESLKDLFERAVATEIGRSRPGRRVSFPLVGSDDPTVTQADIEAADALAQEADDLHQAFG